MKVRLDLDLTDAQVNDLMRTAIMVGFARVEPKKAWRVSEKKEAIRLAIETLIYKE